MLESAIFSRDLMTTMSCAAVVVFALNWYVWPNEKLRRGMLFFGLVVLAVLTGEVISYA